MSHNIKKDFPVLFSSLPLSSGHKFLCLAPHPDDFDSIGISLHILHKNDIPLHVAVLLSGYSGVEDSFCTPATAERKANIRVKEQKNSCSFFGLAEDRVTFLMIKEKSSGDPVPGQENRDRVIEYLDKLKPNIVLLPHRNDTNQGHRWTYSTLKEFSCRINYPIAALLFRDPKTTSIRHDIITPFGEKDAKWKGKLLRFHKSQHKRNLNTRKHGFDDRILKVNRQIAEELSIYKTYAEAFELELLGPLKNEHPFHPFLRMNP